MNDTIVAISTALGVGAISIVRLSGDDAIKTVNKIFKGQNLEEVASHTINYGHICSNTNIIDEVLVSVMRAPKTYTAEDIVEINCHGGIATTTKVLEMILASGIRLANPGEFTERALLNGRIDLIQAEGISDLIASKSEKARQLAISQVEGNLSTLIKSLEGKIIEISANIEVNVDYPEYEDIEIITHQMIKERLEEIEKEIDDLLKMSENSKIIKEGINVLILGRPNVGKSSLLNKLLDEEKAIVTNIAGTTRDIVEGSINLDGIALNIIDTAGIRKTKNIIEQKGVEKSLKLIDQADLVILVLNNNEPLMEEDIEILNKTDHKKRIIFVNKTDLPTKLDIEKIKNSTYVEGNTLTLDGLKPLKEKIKMLFNFDMIESTDYNYLSNARQIAIMKEVLTSIEDIKQGIENHFPLDIIAIDIKKIGELLGNLVGQNYSDDLIDQLFKQFCVGK